MQRLRDVLRQDRSGETPERQYRPNELRLDLIRAERLRREVRRAEPLSSQPAPSVEELQTPEMGPQEPDVMAPATRPHPGASQITALKTRSGLRQAWLLKEILSPPLALRDPSSDDHNP